MKTPYGYEVNTDFSVNPKIEKFQGKTTEEARGKFGAWLEERYGVSI
jgi:hypothetical protein